MTDAYSLVRISTGQQSKGDGVRRQEMLTASEEFCAQKGLTLNRTLRVIGKSAYHGAHVARGPLADFLEIVLRPKSGGERVEPGSWLIVEDMDRLDRRKVTVALEQFLSLLHAGIVIHTMIDGQTYSQERADADPTALIISIVKMWVAHEFSKKLGERITKLWEGRREKMRAGTAKATKNSPKWLQIEDDKFLSYERDGEQWAILTEQHTRLVDKIKDYRAQRLSEETIAKKLNQIDKIPSMRGKAWWGGTVRQFVQNPALRGIYQPKKADETPDGEPITGYYPRVMSDDDWYCMQWAGVKLARGRKSNMPNLFSEVCKCARCGGSLFFINKGERKAGENGRYHGGTYLQCVNAKRGVCDNRYHHTYDVLEAEFLDAITLVDYDSFLTRANPGGDKIAALEAKIATNNVILEKMTKDYIDILKGGGDASPQLVEESKRLTREVREATAELGAARREARVTEALDREDAYEAFRQMIAEMPALEDEARVELRTRIGGEIKRMVQSAKADDTSLVFTLRENPYHRIDLHFDRGRFQELAVVSLPNEDFATENRVAFPAQFLREQSLPGLFSEVFDPTPVPAWIVDAVDKAA